MEQPVQPATPPHIPVIGHLTLIELAGFAAVGVVAMAGAACLALFAPELLKASAPDAGLSAPISAGLALIAVLAASSLLFSAGVGATLLLLEVRHRVDARSAVAAPVARRRVDPQLLLQPMNVLSACFACIAVDALALFFPGNTLSASITVAAFVSLMVFLAALGMLAFRLGLRWRVWVLLTLLTPPFGPYVAYFMMRKRVQGAVGESWHDGFF